MKRRTSRALVIASVVVSTTALLSCAGQTLLGKVDGTNTVLQGAITDGSKTIGCAPKETAIAEANIRFAQDALAMGEYYRGKDHAEKAEIYTALARKKTDPVRCKEGKPTDLVITEGDRDGDGYSDQVDKCPDDPEDFDSFEDDDGCPDKDNDGDGVLDAAEFVDGRWVNNDKKIENGREIDCRNEPEDFDEFEDEDGCPEPDNDRDTIIDANDKCPNDPEDFDQFEDEDGCPDKDNDNDGVLDAAELNRNPDGTYTWTNNDKMMENGVEKDCRNLPEDMDGDRDEDGCPDVLLIDDCQIKLSDKIYFKFDKWDIDPVSYKVLDEVMDTLNAAPTIKVWVDGHTDSKGSNKYNKKLSQKRVDAVAKYLIDKGIGADRLEPRGFGEEVPIADNKTAEGRAENRRVEFNLKDCKKRVK
ncbi:MAG: OmpA family protein [Myxococcales bacterium]|nr:OmpA family protein [Myxococcales bacterium]MCB9706117.1 OmpA family protein [Myxococcales bacterium]